MAPSDVSQRGRSWQELAAGCLAADICMWGSAWVKQRGLRVRADVTPRQGVLAPSISHREDEMERNPLQTHIKGLQVGRGPASGEKRQLDPQATSILTWIFLIHLLLSAQHRADGEQKATEQRRGAESARGVARQLPWAQPHMERSWKRMIRDGTE